MQSQERPVELRLLAPWPLACSDWSSSSPCKLHSLPYTGLLVHSCEGALPPAPLMHSRKKLTNKRCMHFPLPTLHSSPLAFERRFCLPTIYLPFHPVGLPVCTYANFVAGQACKAAACAWCRSRRGVSSGASPLSCFLWHMIDAAQPPQTRGVSALQGLPRQRQHGAHGWVGAEAQRGAPHSLQIAVGGRPAGGGGAGQAWDDSYMAAQACESGKADVQNLPRVLFSQEWAPCALCPAAAPEGHRVEAPGRAQHALLDMVQQQRVVHSAVARANVLEAAGLQVVG